MINRKPTRETMILDETIDELTSELKGWEGHQDEYKAIVARIADLMKLKEELSSKRRVSPETLAVIGGNLAGILLILNFERAGVVASKAMSLVGKIR
jgi:hypothetical protein